MDRVGKLYVLCGLPAALTDVSTWMQRWLLDIGCDPSRFRVLQLEQVPTEKETYELQAAIPPDMTIVALLPTKAEWRTKPQICDAVGHLNEAADCIAGVLAMIDPAHYMLQIVKDRTGLMPQMLAVRAS